MLHAGQPLRPPPLQLCAVVLALAALPGFTPTMAFTPTTMAQPVQQQPRQAPDRAFLGLETEEFGTGGKVEGIKVVYIYPFSAASEMGFQLGDVVFALNDVIIPDRKTFVREVRRNNIGGKLRFLVTRGTERIKIQGKIGSYRKTMEKLRSISVFSSILALTPSQRHPCSDWSRRSRRSTHELRRGGCLRKNTNRNPCQYLAPGQKTVR